ncbi:MAG: sigma-70 family RNA polymerase sigma factor [Bdellovibrionales bacterium]
MSKNSYSGVDSYAAFFVAYKAKTLTRMPMFSADDFEDLQQELMIAYLHAWPSFDPSKGDRRSFIKAAVNNAARNLVVAAEAQKRWTGITLASLATAISDQDDSPTLADAISNEDGLWDSVYLGYDQLSVDLRHDLDRAISQLPPDLARICLLLKTRTITEIAAETGIPRTTIQDAVKKLRKIMGKAGLRIYLS